MYCVQMRIRGFNTTNGSIKNYILLQQKETAFCSFNTTNGSIKPLLKGNKPLLKISKLSLILSFIYKEKTCRPSIL